MSTKIVQTSFGGPEVLELVDQTPPAAAELAADEVLVRVAFAGVNPIDVMTRTGGAMAAAGLITLPFTPGWDLAGTVEAVGSQVETLKVGDRVYGMARFPTRAPPTPGTRSFRPPTWHPPLTRSPTPLRRLCRWRR